MLSIHSGSSRHLLAVAASACALALSIPAASQVGPGRGGPNGQAGNRPQPQNHLAEFKTLADSVGSKFQARVFVDPVLWVPAKPAPPAGSTLEAALDSLVSQVKNAVWRRAYVKYAAIAAPDRLVAAARALETVQETGLVLENPAAGRATTYLKNAPVPPNFADALAAQQFSANPVYVIFSVAPGVPAGSPEDQFYDLQKQQMDMMMQMNPDQLVNAMGRGMQLWQNLDPATRSQVMGQMMRAGFQMFMNMPADQRQQLMQDMMQNMQGMFGQGGPGAPGGPGR